MYKRTLLCTLLSTSVFITSAADTPESFMRQRWYNIEIVVFEKQALAPTPELITRVVEKRVLPANVRGMFLSDRELTSISEFSIGVDFDDKVDELFFRNPWNLTPSLTTPTKVKSGIEEQLITSSEFRDGCWLHLINIGEENSGAFDSENEWLLSLDDTYERNRTRDPRLPDWMPDVWQTFDQNLVDLAKSLGLCEEDVALMLDEEYLAFIREETLTDEQEIPTERTTLGEVHDTFDEYEQQLSRSSLTPQSKNLNLQTTASRLRENGYRIIDHFAWHQSGRARGDEDDILVQFGQQFENGFREVEGTVAFSVARFLHFRVNLWRFVTQPQTYDPEETEIESPLFFYEMQESRRLALGEVHYYDHPKFGVIVQIRRVPIPDELQALVEQLNSTR